MRLPNFPAARMGIEKDLHELLFCHDCVIVPQWGGFLTHYRSAKLDEARRIVHPPGKDVSFNKNLIRSDGLLADHVAKREGRSFKEAQDVIEEAVKQWRDELKLHGRLEMPHIGIFYHDAEKNLQFDPDRSTNFLKDAYGLAPVTALPVEKRTPIVRVLPQPAATGAAVVERRTGAIWAAAAAAAVLFGAGAFWAYNAGAGPQGQWSGFDPFGPAVERTYTPSDGVPAALHTVAPLRLPDGLLGVKEIELPAGKDMHITVDLGSPEPPVPAPAVSTRVTVSGKAATAKAARGRFHVIGGCFAQEENAERFLQELRGKGFDAQRLSRHGELHPVAFGSFSSREEALQAMAHVKENGPYSAWLLVR